MDLANVKLPHSHICRFGYGVLCRELFIGGGWLWGWWAGFVFMGYASARLHFAVR